MSILDDLFTQYYGTPYRGRVVLPERKVGQGDIIEASGLRGSDDRFTMTGVQWFPKLTPVAWSPVWRRKYGKIDLGRVLGITHPAPTGVIQGVPTATGGGTINLEIDQDLSDGNIVVVDDDNFFDPSLTTDTSGRLTGGQDDMAEEGFGLDDIINIGIDLFDGDGFGGSIGDALIDDGGGGDGVPEYVQDILDAAGFGDDGGGQPDRLVDNRSQAELGGNVDGIFTDMDAIDVTDREGRPVVANIQYEQRARCPRGYVAATLRTTGARVCMDREYAIAKGYYKPQGKPPVTRADFNAIRKATSARRKIDKLQDRARSIGKPACPTVRRTRKK